MRVQAQVMTRDDSSGGWVPMGGGGLSNVGLVRRLKPATEDTSRRNEYLIYGQRIADNSVSIKIKRFGFYGPFKNISLTLSRSLIRGGKTGVPGEKTHDLPMQNLASHMYPREALTTAVRDPMFKSQRS